MFGRGGGWGDLRYFVGLPDPGRHIQYMETVILLPDCLLKNRPLNSFTGTCDPVCYRPINSVYDQWNFAIKIINVKFGYISRSGSGPNFSTWLRVGSGQGPGGSGRVRKK